MSQPKDHAAQRNFLADRLQRSKRGIDEIERQWDLRNDILKGIK